MVARSDAERNRQVQRAQRVHRQDNRQLAHLAESASTVAAALGAGVPDGDWEINGLFVTRRVEPAAFADQPAFGFCTPDAVADTINTDDVVPGRYVVEFERAMTAS